MIIAMGFLLITTMVYHLAHKKEADQFNDAYRDNLIISSRNIISMKEQDLQKTTFDYCMWDEMVQFVHKPDASWSDDNLNTINTTLGCSFVEILDEDFTTVFKAVDSAKMDSESFVLNLTTLRNALQGKSSCHFYIHTGTQLIEISSAPIVPSNDLLRKTRPQGYFIIGKVWDGSFLKEIENVTNTNIEIIPATDLVNRKARDEINDQNSIVARQFLSDNNNNKTARLDFISKTQYKQDQNLFLFFTLIPFFISILLGSIYYFLVRAWISTPLKILTNSLDNENPVQLQKISSRNKEFYSLSSMMVAFFEAKKRLEIAFNERKTAEERILKLSTALEQSSSTIVITDNEGIIEYVNKRLFKLTGYNRSEILGKNPRIFKSGHHSKEFYRRLWDTIKSGRTWKGEFLNKKKDGTAFWESATITPIKNINGEIVNFIAVKEDVTEQKAAREQLARYADNLKESNISKDKFFSILAHDLKSPFHSLLGYSELLATEYDTLSDSDRRKFIQILRQSTKNVYDLVENLLQWSRLQTGRMKCNPEVFEIYAEIEYSIDIFRAVALKKNIFLSPAISVGTLVKADRNMVRSIVQNLISNALKFTTSKGHVRVNSFEKDGEVIVQVTDTGIGMDTEEVNKLFRIDVEFTKKGTAMESGTGLGLILCKELVTSNGGRIWAESTPGKGSVFSFTLPSGKL